MVGFQNIRVHRFIRWPTVRHAHHELLERGVIGYRNASHLVVPFGDRSQVSKFGRPYLFTVGIQARIILIL